jgi:copper chaperone
MHQVLNVQGMTCGHCEMAVTNAVKRVDPAANVTIDRASGRVEVDSEQSIAAISRAIIDEGYAVQAETAQAKGCGGGCSCG